MGTVYTRTNCMFNFGVLISTSAIYDSSATRVEGACCAFRGPLILTLSSSFGIQYYGGVQRTLRNNQIFNFLLLIEGDTVHSLQGDRKQNGIQGWLRVPIS